MKWKHPGLVLLFVLFAFISNAQQSHFIYLQTDNGQAFYIKRNNQITSSSVSGFLIIPKLETGEFDLVVGFPKNEFPEENFQIPINNNQGYLLKNFGEKGWGLFNLQSLGVTMGVGERTGSASKVLQDDPFSKMLANVVKDSTLLEKKLPPPIPQVPISDSLLEAAKPALPDSADIIAKASPTVKEDLAQAKNEASGVIISQPGADTVLLSDVHRTLRNESKDGLQLIYIDDTGVKKDTIRILMPFLKTKPEISSAFSPVDTAVSAPVETEKTPLPPDTAHVASAEIVPDEAKDSTIAINVETQKSIDVAEVHEPVKGDVVNIEPLPDTINTNIAGAPELTSKPATQDDPTESDEKNVAEVEKILPRVVNSSRTNTDCRAFADNADFIKLRKKMAGENNADGMIRAAKKVFHTRCFSVEQIKNLSFLFLTDGGKYQFFDAAYPFTSNSGEYELLQTQLTDEYYLNRFRAMINK
ncbi:MAG: hypothetical protein ABIR19_08925 [Ginsengibacter sp.]